MQSSFEIPLWPGTSPGSEALSLQEQVDERSPDTSAYLDRAISCVARPRMHVFRPERSNGTVMLIAPGGGYQRVVWDKEGAEMARWLTALGVTACVLTYRLPGEGHRDAHLVPLQDAQRAMRLIRHHASPWGCDPTRVGAMGFSAGGHVIASLATAYGRSVYEPRDACDALFARPDFVVLGYPVISMAPSVAHAGSRLKLLGSEPDPALQKAFSCDECVTAEVPETFLMLADDDASVSSENSVRYYSALRRAGVKAELHVFRDGGHGFGIRGLSGPARAWTGLCETWLRANRWLPAE